MPDTARLEGGPFEGADVERGHDALNVTGDEVPDGHVAVYRWHRGRQTYVYEGLAEIVLRVEMPGA